MGMGNETGKLAIGDRVEFRHAGEADGVALITGETMDSYGSPQWKLLWTAGVTSTVSKRVAQDQMVRVTDPLEPIELGAWVKRRGGGHEPPLQIIGATELNGEPVWVVGHHGMTVVKQWAPHLLKTVQPPAGEDYAPSGQETAGVVEGDSITVAGVDKSPGGHVRAVHVFAGVEAVDVNGAPFLVDSKGDAILHNDTDEMEAVEEHLVRRMDAGKRYTLALVLTDQTDEGAVPPNDNNYNTDRGLDLAMKARGWTMHDIAKALNMDVQELPGVPAEDIAQVLGLAPEEFAVLCDAIATDKVPDAHVGLVMNRLFAAKRAAFKGQS